MESLKNLIKKIGECISSLFCDLLDGISDGIEYGDIGEIAKNMVFLCILFAFVLLLGYVLVLLAFRNSVKLVIFGFLLAAAYSLYLKLTGVAEVEPEPIRKPTMEDYQAVLETVKPALAKVAPALGLAPIYDYTDITIDPDSAITPYGKIYRMVYGTLKGVAGIKVDTDMCKRVLQLQVKRVLDLENPSGFQEIRFPWGGRLEPIIQVDLVDQDDAYIYVFVVMASQVYFQQRADMEKRRNMPAIETDADDTDF